MKNLSSLAKRFALFLPLTLPFWFLRELPPIHIEQPHLILQLILYIYLIPILLDLIAGANHDNTHSDLGWTAKAPEYRTLVRALAVKVLLLKGAMFYLLFSQDFNAADALALAFLTGQTAAAYGIVVAHELVHRKSRIDQFLAEMVMVSVQYPQFCIEHVYGHHKHMATRLDPATARFGQSIYAFLPRTLAGGLVSAWGYEVRRLHKQGRGWLSVRNRMLRYLVEVIALNGAVYYFLGVLGVAALLLQSAVAVISFEVINYMQHYGLERKENAPGIFESPSAAHSWSTESRFSNTYWLNLGRHSDHHSAVGREFQVLRHLPEEPTLPAGLAAMEAWRRRNNIPPQHAQAAAAQSGEDERRSDVSGITGRPENRQAENVLKNRRRFATSSRYAVLTRVGAYLFFGAIALLIAFDIYMGLPWGLVALCILCVAVVAIRGNAVADDLGQPVNR